MVKHLNLPNAIGHYGLPMPMARGLSQGSPLWRYGRSLTEGASFTTLDLCLVAESAVANCLDVFPAGSVEGTGKLSPAVAVAEGA